MARHVRGIIITGERHCGHTHNELTLSQHDVLLKVVMATFTGDSRMYGSKQVHLADYDVMIGRYTVVYKQWAE